MGEAVSNAQLEREIEILGWKVRDDFDSKGHAEFQAFFRGWQTQWRGSLEQVLADVKAYQEPERVNDE